MRASSWTSWILLMLLQVSISVAIQNGRSIGNCFQWEMNCATWLRLQGDCALFCIEKCAWRPFQRICTRPASIDRLGRLCNHHVWQFCQFLIIHNIFITWLGQVKEITCWSSRLFKNVGEGGPYYLLFCYFFQVDGHVQDGHHTIFDDDSMVPFRLFRCNVHPHYMY